MSEEQGRRLSPKVMCVLAASWGVASESESVGSVVNPVQAGTVWTSRPASVTGGAAGVAVRLLERGVVPRAAVEQCGGAGDARDHSEARLWLDVRGLAVSRVSARVRSVLRSLGAGGVRLGVATVPVAAYAAARTAGPGGDDDLVIVSKRGDRAFLSPLPLDVLEADAKLLDLLAGVGVERCGELASLSRESVEVRFGGPAIEAWQRARGEDRRVPFGGPAPSLPSSSLDFIDYVVTDPERLAFVANALLANVCDALAERGMHARRLVLALPLANGTTWRRVLKAARPTASRAVWLRRIQQELERLTVPDAVAGVALAAEAAEAAASVQGDLFDPGFATAASVESALERLLEAQGTVVVRPEPTVHPLPERRNLLEPVAPESLLRQAAVLPGGGPTGLAPDPPGLTLQLLPQPRPVLVETVERRDHAVPVRYRDGGWRSVVTAMGPERVSGGLWDAPYAREYYRVVAADGALVWLFREGRHGEWYLHGWWD